VIFILGKSAYNNQQDKFTYTTCGLFYIFTNFVLSIESVHGKGQQHWARAKNSFDFNNNNKNVHQTITKTKIDQFQAKTTSDRPEQKCLPEPEPNRNYISIYWTETGTENWLEPKQEPEPKPEPK